MKDRSNTTSLPDAKKNRLKYVKVLRWQWGIQGQGELWPPSGHTDSRD